MGSAQTPSSTLSSAMTKKEMEIVFDLATKALDWTAAAKVLNAQSGKSHHVGNLKKHWTTILKPRVVRGYIDEYRT